MLYAQELLDLSSYKETAIPDEVRYMKLVPPERRRVLEHTSIQLLYMAVGRGLVVIVGACDGWPLLCSYFMRRVSADMWSCGGRLSGGRRLGCVGKPVEEHPTSYIWPESVNTYEDRGVR